MKTKHNLYISLFAGMASVAFSSLSFGAEFTVIGQGSAAMGPDLGVTREASLHAAMRDAVLAAIRKINGPTSTNDPKVMAAAEQILAQVGNEYILDQTTRKDAANNFVTGLKLKLDDKEFRKLLSDAGIALKTANNYPILIVMDEYFTTPTDSQKPLREIVELFSDKSEHHKEVVAAQGQTSGSFSANSSQSANASASRTFSSNDSVVSSDAARNFSASASGSVASNQSASSSLNRDLDMGKKDIQTSRSVVEYQPQNTQVSDNNYTYAAILREAASYDLNVIDNGLFRSKYFTGKALTLQELQNSPEFARYVAAAREDAKADYFMAGSSIIYDLGKDKISGQSRCDGVVALKTFSTAESKVIATDSRSESASGNTPDQCRVNVANKMAVFTASVVGTQIAEYWKNRVMYGQQYTVKLVSLLGQLNFQTKRNFGKALEQVKGVKDVPAKRKEDNREVEYSLQYAGETPIGDVIGELIASSDAFKTYPNFDINTLGTNVRICLESSCPK